MSNFTEKDFLKQLGKSLETDAGLTVTEWIAKHDLKTSDGHNFDFDKFPFMVEILNQECKEMVVMSSAQMGKTESMFLFALKKVFEGTSVIMSEPIEDLRNVLVKTKLNQLISGNKHFKDNVRGDLSVKTVGTASLFTPYTNGAGLVGFSAAVNIYDEVSMSNPDNIALLRGRQLAQENTREIFLSNPDMPYDLLHTKFLESNQCHWTISPSCCNKAQILNYDGIYGFQGNIDKERETFVCQHCKEELNPETITAGYWTERYPGRRIKGYWLHQMMRYCKNVEVMRERAAELIREEERNKRTFNRMFMGLPYAGSDVTFSEELFIPLCQKEEPPGQNIIMGLDIGASEKESGGHHYILGNGAHVVEMGTFKTLDDAEEFIVKRNVQMVVSDYMPDYERVKMMQMKFPAIVWRAYFNGTRKDNDLKWKAETGLVDIPKHTTMDSLIDDLKDKKFSFSYSASHPTMKEFMRQCATVSKIPGFDAQQNPSFKWEAPKGADDHFAMTLLYYYVAFKRWQEIGQSHGIYQSADYNPKEENWISEVDRLFEDTDSQKDWTDY